MSVHLNVISETSHVSKLFGSTAHVDTLGLPPWSRSSSCTVLDAKSTSIQRVKNGDSGYDPIIGADQLEKIMVSQHDSEDRDRKARQGAVLGLVVTCMGEGEIMPFESIATPGNRNVKRTGPLGDVCVFSSPVPRRRVDVLIWVRLCRF